LGANPLPAVDTSQAVTKIITYREEHLKLLKQRLEQAQNRMKMQADKNRSDWQFAVGDQVLLRLHPYTLSSVASRRFPKLAYKFFGPYKILERIGAVAYKIELPAHSEIHPVFLCSVLHSGDIPLSLTSLAIAVGHGCYTGLPHNMVGEELARELYGVFVDQLSLYRVNYKAYKLVKTNRPYIGSLP